MAGRAGRGIVVALVALLILAAAVYAPIALLAPLPATEGVPVTAEAPTDTVPAVALPAGGASGVTLGAASEPVVGGTSDALPMAAAAKLVTALVVLDQRPLTEGRSGPAIEITADDFDAYARYRDEGTRAVRVVTGDEWTQREVLQATLIASSNNHAELLARWAFGSEEAYLSAARDWLDANGLAETRVADPTGLSPESASTGADLARLAALAMADPLLAELVATPSGTTIRGASFENTIAYRPGEGLLGISRSYTDEAGVCLLFAYPTEIDGVPVTVYGAFAGESSYDDLDADVDAFLASLPSALTMQDVVVPGDPYGRYETAWGATASAVAKSGAQGIGWAGAAGGDVEVRLDPVVTARGGATVGAATATTLQGRETVVLELDSPLADPGPLWRFANPGVVVPAFLQMVQVEG